MNGRLLRRQHRQHADAVTYPLLEVVHDGEDSLRCEVRQVGAAAAAVSRLGPHAAEDGQELSAQLLGRSQG